MAQSLASLLSQFEKREVLPEVVKNPQILRGLLAFLQDNPPPFLEDEDKKDKDSPENLITYYNKYLKDTFLETDTSPENYLAYKYQIRQLYDYVAELVAADTSLEAELQTFYPNKQKEFTEFFKTVVDFYDSEQKEDEEQELPEESVTQDDQSDVATGAGALGSGRSANTSTVSQTEGGGEQPSDQLSEPSRPLEVEEPINPFVYTKAQAQEIIREAKIAEVVIMADFGLDKLGLTTLSPELEQVIYAKVRDHLGSFDFSNYIDRATGRIDPTRMVSLRAQLARELVPLIERDSLFRILLADYLDEARLKNPKITEEVIEEIEDKIDPAQKQARQKADSPSAPTTPPIAVETTVAETSSEGDVESFADERQKAFKQESLRVASAGILNEKQVLEELAERLPQGDLSQKTPDEILNSFGDYSAHFQQLSPVEKQQVINNVRQVQEQQHVARQQKALEIFGVTKVDNDAVLVAVAAHAGSGKLTTKELGQLFSSEEHRQLFAQLSDSQQQQILDRVHDIRDNYFANIAQADVEVLGKALQAQRGPSDAIFRQILEQHGFDASHPQARYLQEVVDALVINQVPVERFDSLQAIVQHYEKLPGVDKSVVEGLREVYGNALVKMGSEETGDALKLYYSERQTHFERVTGKAVIVDSDYYTELQQIAETIQNTEILRQQQYTMEEIAMAYYSDLSAQGQLEADEYNRVRNLRLALFQQLSEERYAELAQAYQIEAASVEARNLAIWEMIQQDGLMPYGLDQQDIQQQGGSPLTSMVGRARQAYLKRQALKKAKKEVTKKVAKEGAKSLLRTVGGPLAAGGLLGGVTGALLGALQAAQPIAIGASALAGAGVGFWIGGPIGAVIGGIAGGIAGWFGHGVTTSIVQSQVGTGFGFGEGISQAQQVTQAATSNVSSYSTSVASDVGSGLSSSMPGTVGFGGSTASVATISLGATAGSLGLVAAVSTMSIAAIISTFQPDANTENLGPQPDEFSKYVEITKTASPERIANNQNTTVSYSIRITPKSGYTITPTALTDKFSYLGGGDAVAPSLPDQTDIIVNNTDDEFALNQPLIGPVTIEYTVPNVTGVDVLVNNTFELVFDVVDAGGSTVTTGQKLKALASVTIGNPQLGCFVFGEPGYAFPNGTRSISWNPGEQERVMRAFLSRAATNPMYVTLLCGEGGSKGNVTIYRLPGSEYGGWAPSALGGAAIGLYDLGLKYSDASTEYTLIHEFGHIIDYRNPGLRQQYLQARSSSSCYTYPIPSLCSGAEAFAEGSMLYVVYTTYAFSSGRYETGEQGTYNFKQRFPGDYEWFKNNMFGGKECNATDCLQ